MRQFWNSDIAEKSFQALIKLNKEFNFILIGGWAIYLWSKKMKSKDIDIVVNFAELGKIREKYHLRKNPRLKKYEINFKEFDVDIYLPHYSKIGFPLENLNKQIQNIEGFRVPKVEILLLMKLFVFSQRKNSTKGEKDKIDILSLLDSVEINWKKFKQLCRKYNKNLPNILKEILENTRSVRELGINSHQISRLRKEILKELN